MVCVIPGGATCKPDFNKLLSSLLKVNEIDIINAALSGDLDRSILKSPCVHISSSCSTDETIVADSDTEVETATSPYASEALCGGNNVKTEELVDDSGISDKRKNDRTEASLDDVSAGSHKRKNERMEASIDDVSTSLHEIKRAKADISLDASVRSDTLTTSFKDGTGDIKVKKDKVDDYASGNSDVIYSQNLIVRDINRPTNRSTAPNSSVPNFKRFRKPETQSGNSFNNLVPFAKYPYKDSDYGNDETAEYVKEEKRRKQREAVADDLFNNQKAKKRGTAGSIHGILTR